MTGPKLNEANFVKGSKSGSRASARYHRSSASKVRVVLNLVRNQDVRTADQILQFTDREAARVVRKVLASAVANAVTNDHLDADELFVKACFADEGPTMKRFRPRRAKGRAGAILKRTCHITLIVDRMSDSQLAVIEAKTMAKGAPSNNRRARVAASRKEAPAVEQEIVADDQVVDTTTTEEAGN